MSAVRSNARDIVTHLTTENAPEWTSRWNTRTMTLIDKKGNANIVDASQENFRSPDLIDYTSVSKDSDGAAKVRDTENV